MSWPQVRVLVKRWGLPDRTLVEMYGGLPFIHVIEAMI